MTPAERALVAELFDRLATLENAPRDPEAESLIRDGSRRAPNAPYSLVQTVLVQDEALKRADARIQELEGELGSGAPPAREPGFLDSMRDALLGRPQPAEPRAGSVPSVRPADTTRSSAWGQSPDYRSGAQPMAAEPMRPGGSFLGNAAATAAGVIGGSLLMDSVRGMMGGHGRSAAAFDPSGGGTGGSPGEVDAAGGELSRQAGLDDIGRSPSGRRWRQRARAWPVRYCRQRFLIWGWMTRIWTPMMTASTMAVLIAATATAISPERELIASQEGRPSGRHSAVRCPRYVIRSRRP